MFKKISILILTVLILSGCQTTDYLESPERDEIQENVVLDPTPTAISSEEAPPLSEDHKNIAIDGKILLVIDDDVIFNFFKTKSDMCNEYSITNIPSSRMFCENRATFKSMTRFGSIVVSPDKMTVGFAIESDILSPDTVVGVFYPFRTEDKIHFLTNYYLGNIFISFSPTGKYFVYQGNCWEGMCGLYVKDSETLAEIINLNDPEYADLRIKDATFVRWISDNEVEYKLGTELKRISF